MDRFTIRKATRDDEAAVYDVLSHHICPENLKSRSLPFERFTDPDDPTSLFVACTDDGQVIGTTILHQFEGVAGVLDALKGATLPSAADLTDGHEFEAVGYLATAYVHSDYLREGAGWALREYVEAEARRCGLDAMFVEVWAHDEERDARRPLRRSGYDAVFVSDEYWPASLPEDTDALCSACGSDCDCIGAIFRKLL